MTRHTVPLGDTGVVNHGQLPAGLVEYARDRITQLRRYTPEPIPHVRITLTTSSDRAVARPAQARATLDVNGRLLHGCAHAATPREAIDLLRTKLQQRLTRTGTDRQNRRGRVPVAGVRRHVPAPERQVPRLSEQQQILPHPTYEPPLATVDEAVFDMNHLGDDFHLFTDEHTGEEAVVYRAGPAGYRLARLHPATGPTPQTAVPLTVSPVPAPRLSPGAAVERLDLTGQRFVFYADADTGRGCVLYRRDDGRYGLIAPPAPTSHGAGRPQHGSDEHADTVDGPVQAAGG